MSAELDTKKITGPLFIGTFLTWALLGSLTIQLYDYHNTSRRSDRVAIQILVYGVFIVELLQTSLITHSNWVTLIAKWGNTAAIADTPWSSTTTPVINGFVAACVQCFFAWRIWTLSRTTVARATTALIVAVAAMQLAASAAVTGEYTLLNRDYSRLLSVSRAAETWLAGSLVCDSVIAIAMVIILIQAQHRSRFKSTETILNRLIINTIETGAITAGLALIELILFHVYPSDFYHVTLEYVLGRMYSNVLLASLNGRHRSRTAHRNAVNTFGTINGQAGNGTDLNSYTLPNTPKAGQHADVVISTSVETDTEMDTYGKGKIAAI
ncbi:hypothetical protein K438DRAFT_1978250 [Mycena galopus ATCC 62051]|nr:hypothetical protein K438DRAFT_1978250 [Mycena galopus ATCC 62051]